MDGRWWAPKVSPEVEAKPQCEHFDAEEPQRKKTRADDVEFQNLLEDNRRLKEEIESRDCNYESLEASLQQLLGDVCTHEHRAKWYEKLGASMMNCTKDCRGCAEKIKAICDNAQ